VLFALLSCKIPAHLFAKPPAEVHNAHQCSGIVCAFRLVEAQNNGASIRKPLVIENQGCRVAWHRNPVVCFTAYVQKQKTLRAGTQG
jgi:hypothetical protein